VLYIYSIQTFTLLPFTVVPEMLYWLPHGCMKVYRTKHNIRILLICSESSVGWGWTPCVAAFLRAIRGRR